MDIDTTFHMDTDARGRDPDSYSPTLKNTISCCGINLCQMEKYLY